MSDNESETASRCFNCPTCVAQRKKVHRIEREFYDIDMKKEKLYSAYESNLAHIQAQIEKIKTAERIKRKFEMNLEANKEDMIAIRDKCASLYKEMDDDGNLEYYESKKVARLAELTLPPPPRTIECLNPQTSQTSGSHPTHSQSSSSDAHTPEDDEPSASS